MVDQKEGGIGEDSPELRMARTAWQLCGVQKNG